MQNLDLRFLLTLVQYALGLIFLPDVLLRKCKERFGRVAEWSSECGVSEVLVLRDAIPNGGTFERVMQQC